MSPASKLLLALFLTLLSAASTATAQQSAYTLNAGDTIRVHVYGEPDLSFERLLIGQIGLIYYPFLGELKVTGNTAVEVQQTLGAGLKPDYLIVPRISVSIV